MTSEKVRHALDGVSKTSLITMVARARESQRSDATIHDDYAETMVSKIKEDLSSLRMGRHDEITLIMRMTRIDDQVRGFLLRNPDGVVVHFGCGVDTRFQRVDNGRVEWFDIDLPAVIALREKLLDVENPRYHCIAGSILKDDWIGEVGKVKPGPFMFAGEGVLIYLEEEQVRDFVLRLRDHFAGCELVCDASEPYVVWLDNLHLWSRGIPLRMHWGLKRPSDMETWGDGIRLVEAWNYYDSNRQQFKENLLLRLLGRMWRSAGVYRYQLGKVA